MEQQKAYDEQQVIEQVASHLQDRFPDRDPGVIDEVAADTVHGFADAKVKDYVGPLAEHRARDILNDRAESQPS